MSAERLREAADAIREEDYPPGVGKAVAAWLREVARSGTGAHLLPALAVADAILGGAGEWA